MVGVVAVASPGNSDFAVINFSTTPPTVVMAPGFDGGNVVDCYGTVAAVAGYSGVSVALFDISWPETPVQTATLETGFQIGSISIYGSYVLTGEFNGSRVSLIDISDPANPYVLSVSDCAPSLNIISSVALRSPTFTGDAPKLTAVVSGDNNSVILYFGDSTAGTVAAPLLYNAWPSDFDGWTAAVANAGGGIHTYAVAGNDATQLPVVPYTYLTGSVAVAEIPSGGYYVAAGSQSEFTVFGYPQNYPSGSIKTVLPGDISSTGTAVKFLNNPAIAPFLTVANVIESGVFVYFYFLQVETGGPKTVVSFFTPILETQVALSTGYLPTLGITAFTPVPSAMLYCFSAASGSRDSGGGQSFPQQQIRQRRRRRYICFGRSTDSRNPARILPVQQGDRSGSGKG